jgi:hypothetical protein
MARLAILTDARAAARARQYGMNVFAPVYGEMLAHRGIGFQVVSDARELRAAEPDLVVVGLAGSEPDDHAALVSFARSGGVVVACGGLTCMARALGFTPFAGRGPGYARFGPSEERFSFVASMRPPEDDIGLRFLLAHPWVVRADNPAPSGNESPMSEDRSRFSRRPRAFGRLRISDDETGYDLLHEVPVGRGVIARFAVDIGHTVSLLRQGPRPVVRDGLPAPDGTADVDDGVLKADDMIALDWDRDRCRTATGIPYFPFPFADWWRELLTGYLVRLMWERGLSVPFTDYWPSGARHALTISHDSDGNVDAHAETTLGLLDRFDVRSTWCILEPGFTPAVSRKAHDAGHEIAFHYNAVAADSGTWGADEFARQLASLRSSLPDIEITSNKNHLTRMEGWGELFTWCERGGIEADQTRGPSKRGNLAFLFATCHPYRPVAQFDEQNRLYDVLEMGFLTPDMNTGIWGDESLIEPLLRRVRHVEGLAHFLFHQVHLHQRSEVRDAFAATVRAAREHGFRFLTGADVNAWERLRRRSLVQALGREGAPVIDSVCRGHGLIVVVPVSATGPGDTRVTQRYGVPCREWAV